MFNFRVAKIDFQLLKLPKLPNKTIQKHAVDKQQWNWLSYLRSVIYFQNVDDKEQIYAWQRRAGAQIRSSFLAGGHTFRGRKRWAQPVHNFYRHIIQIWVCLVPNHLRTSQQLSDDDLASRDNNKCFRPPRVAIRLHLVHTCCYQIETLSNNIWANAFKQKSI